MGGRAVMGLWAEEHFKFAAALTALAAFAAGSFVLGWVAFG